MEVSVSYCEPLTTVDTELLRVRVDATECLGGAGRGNSVEKR